MNLGVFRRLKLGVLLLSSNNLDDWTVDTLGKVGLGYADTLSRKEGLGNILELKGMLNVSHLTETTSHCLL